MPSLAPLSTCTATMSGPCTLSRGDIGYGPYDASAAAAWSHTPNNGVIAKGAGLTGSAVRKSWKGVTWSRITGSSSGSPGIPPSPRSATAWTGSMPA